MFANYTTFERLNRLVNMKSIKCEKSVKHLKQTNKVER